MNCRRTFVLSSATSIGIPKMKRILNIDLTKQTVKFLYVYVCIVNDHDQTTTTYFISRKNQLTNYFVVFFQLVDYDNFSFNKLYVLVGSRWFTCSIFPFFKKVSKLTSFFNLYDRSVFCLKFRRQFEQWESDDLMIIRRQA